MTTPAWISLGSNLGARRAILDAALLALSRVAGVVVARVSSYRETTPVGGPPGQGPFLNAAARLDTTLSPRELLAATQQVERDLGRVRAVRWGERTLDIDLLIYGSKFVDEPDLKLPHPRLAVRRFVLEPLAEIAPDVVDTMSGRTATSLLAELDRLPRIVMLDVSISHSMPELASRLVASLSGILAQCEPKEQDIPRTLSLFKQHDRVRLLHESAAIRAALAKARDSEQRWIVVDVALDPRLLRKVLCVCEDHYRDEELMARARREQPQFWLTMQIARNLDGFPDPTLIVTATGGEAVRRPGMSRTPIYWPEATEPDALLAEIVAVCRGIDGR